MTLLVCGYLGNIEYSCPVMNECEITKRRRKACQACRFQKCLQAGMMREGTSVCHIWRPSPTYQHVPVSTGVRMDRVRGGRQKYKRVDAGMGLYPKAPFPHPVICVREFTHFTFSISTTSLLPFFQLNVVCPSGNKVISHLLLTEPTPLAANQDDSTNDSSLQTMLTLCDLLNRELLVLISWSKQIPGIHTRPKRSTEDLASTFILMFECTTGQFPVNKENLNAAWPPEQTPGVYPTS